MELEGSSLIAEVSLRRALVAGGGGGGGGLMLVELAGATDTVVEDEEVTAGARNSLDATRKIAACCILAN